MSEKGANKGGDDKGSPSNWALRVALGLLGFTGFLVVFPCALAMVPFPVPSLLTLLVLVLVAPLLAAAATIPFGPVSPRQAAILAMTLSIFLCVTTDLGILAVGHKVWIQAAAIGDDDEAACRLRVVLESTQYGPNVLERAILTWPSPKGRTRLLEAAMKAAPSTRWRARFQARAAQLRAEQPTEEPNGPP